MTQHVSRLAAMVAAVATVAICLGFSAHASAAAASTQAVAAVRTAASGGTWSNAIEVPGTATLNAGGFGVTRSVSCASAGNCSAGGFYTQSSGNHQAFVVGETNGMWGTAKPIAAALNAGGFATTGSVSCSSAGNCSAGGFYTDGSFHGQAFVVTERNGTWGAVKEVPGTAALNRGGGAQISSVSCASAGNCSAGGSYRDSSNHGQAFVVNQTNGTWGTAKKVATGLNQGGSADLISVSCAAAGNCSAGGIYTDGSNHAQAFVINQANGTWGVARKVGAALNQGGNADINSVSCTSAGNCGAGGYYSDRSSHFQAFVINEKNGVWGSAKEVAAALNLGGNAKISSVSCASAGACSAGGSYTDGSGHGQAFVVNETNGTWGSAKEVAAALSHAGLAGINSVSCASAGNCSAGGFYTDGTGHGQAFVAGETNGTWGTAEEVPGTAGLNQGGRAAVRSVSCAAAGHCSAGGSYLDGSGNTQAFVVDES
jgi:D-alanine-D-alanine ligase-like ATP-grasp enzyme